MHMKHISVGKQRQRPFVIVAQLATEHKLRADYCPQRHHRKLLIPREPCSPVRATTVHGTNSDMTKRQHISIRPAYLLRPPFPLVTTIEHIQIKVAIDLYESDSSLGVQLKQRIIRFRITPALSPHLIVKYCGPCSKVLVEVHTTERRLSLIGKKAARRPSRPLAKNFDEK